MADPFDPAAGHLFYMADPTNPADHFFYQGLGLVNADPHPPHPGTSFNGAPGAADANDGGPTASDEQQEYSPWAAPSVPSVGRRDDDHELERRKKHAPPARSRENWLSHAALMVAQSAASMSSVSPDRDHGRTVTRRGGPQQLSYPPNQPYDPANPYDQTHGPHPSCPLCGTPYQWGPSGWGQPQPGSTDVYRPEHMRDGPHPSRCPACHCPTRTQLSPTGAPNRFLSSGRREYITGYPSQSQNYLGGVTTTAPHANTNHTSPPYGSPAGVYGDATRTRTDTSSQRNRTGSRIRGRTPSRRGDDDAYDDTYRNPESYASGVYIGSRPQTALSTEYLPAATRDFRHNTANFAPASISERRGPAPANEQFVTSTTQLVASTPLSSANVAVTSQEGQADGADAAYSGSTKEALVSDMIIKGFIKSNGVADVMRAVDRSHYVTDKAKAYSAVTHLTEQGVTVPAPHIHAAILESILPYTKPGSHVLDVGASTGLFAAMLYHRTGKDGVTVILPPSDEVIGLAKQNLVADRLDQALQEGRILLVKGDEKSGYVPCAPYNVIHVMEVVEEIPPLLLTQLASPGRMVIPVRTDGRNAMLRVDKDAAGNVSQKELTDLL